MGLDIAALQAVVVNAENAARHALAEGVQKSRRHQNVMPLVSDQCC